MYNRLKYIRRNQCDTITNINHRLKIFNLAEAIAAGTFKIDAHKIARKIIATSILKDRKSVV